MGQPRVLKGVSEAGQFTTTGHSDAVPALAFFGPDPACMYVANAAVERRATAQRAKQDLDKQIAVESAIILAARAKALFPEARYILFRGTGDSEYDFTPEAIVDADRETVASADDNAEGWYRWEASETDHSGHLLAFDLQNHDGTADGLVTASDAGLLNRYRYSELDIDKSMERTAP